MANKNLVRVLFCKGVIQVTSLPIFNPKTNEMRLLFVFLIIFCFRCTTIYSQVYEYQFSTEIKQDSILSKSSARLSYHLSYIGAYEEALKMEELNSEIRLENKLTKEDTIAIGNLRAVDAHSYITNQAKKEQIIIINEAHHKPLHRVFTKQLLPSLYEQGYRYLALEAFPNFDGYMAMLDSLGYVEKGEWLTYLKEPQMADLIREAKKIGYELVAYERTNRGTNREEAQAKNIVDKVLTKDPKAKILIHCGYCHLLESEGEKAKNCGQTKWMAKYLQEFSGINPLTIDQDIFTERYKEEENPFYPLLNNVDAPSIFFTENKEAFNANIPFDIDLLVVHPRTKYLYNRPHWLVNQPDFQSVFIDEKEFIGLNYPCLVEARLSKEKETAVPVDIFETTSKHDIKALILPKQEDFIISIKGIQGKRKTLLISTQNE